MGGAAAGNVEPVVGACPADTGKKTHISDYRSGHPTQFSMKNKANNLLKIQRSVPESDKTKPTADTFRAERFEAKWRTIQLCWTVVRKSRLNPLTRPAAQSARSGQVRSVGDLRAAGRLASLRHPLPQGARAALRRAWAGCFHEGQPALPPAHRLRRRRDCGNGTLACPLAGCAGNPELKMFTVLLPSGRG